MKPLLVLILLTVCTASLPAAETIRWDDLQKYFGGKPGCLNQDTACDGLVKDRGVDVFTKDGRKHHARRLLIASVGLRLYDRHDKMEALPRDTVKRIRIWQRDRYNERIVLGAVMPLYLASLVFSSESGPILTVIGAVAAVPFSAVSLASVPVFAALDAITFLIPPNVYDITP